jgi:hypothetical protein
MKKITQEAERLIEKSTLAEPSENLQQRKTASCFSECQGCTQKLIPKFQPGLEQETPSTTARKLVIHFADTNIATMPIMVARAVANEFLAGHPQQPAITPTNEVV